MQTERGGPIINITSIYDMVGPDYSIYAGAPVVNPVNHAFAQGGIIGLSWYLASFLAPGGMRVNSLPLGQVGLPRRPRLSNAIIDAERS